MLDLSQNSLSVKNSISRETSQTMSDTKQVDQDFLDSSQYQATSILLYESVYGEDFVSPGGQVMASEMIKRMALTPGARVLDVGCGLGGSAFVMARDFGLLVDGIDLSKNMLALANKKLAANGLSGSVTLQWGDCLELERVDHYDAVYSRDVFLHIDAKQRLFSVLYAALREGGTLLFTDYCCSPKPWSDEFSDYVEGRGYSLHTTDEYAELIVNAGFEEVAAEDITPRFIEILGDDIERIERSDMDQETRRKLQHSWRQKLARAEAGYQRWGLFTARKGISQATGSE